MKRIDQLELPVQLDTYLGIIMFNQPHITAFLSNTDSCRPSRPIQC